MGGDDLYHVVNSPTIRIIYFMNNLSGQRQPAPLGADEFLYWPQNDSLEVLKQAARERLRQRQHDALEPFPNDRILAAITVPSEIVIDVEVLPRYLTALAFDYADRTPEVVDDLRRSGKNHLAEQRLQASASIGGIIADIRLSADLSRYLNM
jgi:hypothetical protein